MQQSSPWEVANSSSNSQEIRDVVWSLWVYSHVHKSQPLFPTLRKINQPTPSHPITLTSILISSFHPCLSLPCGLFPSSSTFVYFFSSPWKPEVSKILSCLNYFYLQCIHNQSVYQCHTQGHEQFYRIPDWRQYWKCLLWCCQELDLEMCNIINTRTFWILQLHQHSNTINTWTL